MNAQHITQAKLLTRLGALPFVASVGIELLGWHDLHIAYFVIAYGAVIVSFLAGIHWGLFLLRNGQLHLNLLLSSNVLALFAWASLLIPPVEIQLLVQMLCFVVLLWIDKQLSTDMAIEPWFYALRKQITAVVLLCEGSLFFLYAVL